MAKFIPRLVNSRFVRAQIRGGACSPISSLLSHVYFSRYPPKWRACSHAKLFPIYPSISSSCGLSQLQCTRRVFVRSLLTESVFKPPPPTPPHPSNQKRTHLTFIIIIFLTYESGKHVYFASLYVLINIPLPVIPRPRRTFHNYFKKKNRSCIIFLTCAIFLVNFVDNQHSTRPRSQGSLLPVPGNEVAQHNEQHTGVQYVQYIYSNPLVERLEN